MSSPSETTVEHAQRRLGLLTSSAAKIVMHGSERAWKSLSQKLWTERPEDFNRALSVATEYGHAHEAEGAAKFWESHPWVESMREDTFFTLRAQNAPLGSSPDRVLVAGDSQMFGLEIKSPTSDDNFDSQPEGPLRPVPARDAGDRLQGLVSVRASARPGGGMEART